MAQTVINLLPTDSELPAANFPAKTVINGTTSYKVLQFDDTTDETCYWLFQLQNYLSGLLTVTIYWYAASSSSGSVVWEASIAAITPNMDSQNTETKDVAASDYVQTTHPGTTVKRMLSSVITITNLNSLANGDILILKLNRDANGTRATDDLTGDANVAFVTVTYTAM